MISEDIHARVLFLKKVVQKEFKHLTYSDEQTFKNLLTINKVKSLATDEAFSETVEAFGSRFGRFQDTLGQKLLPLWIKVLGEQPAALIDNLNKAEQLGILSSTEEWLRIRELRNQMVHEYIEDNTILLNALQSAHQSIPLMQNMMHNLLKDLDYRLLDNP